MPTGIALLAVWVTNGIWHGPQWNYLVYGLYYFVIIFGGMLCQPLFDRLYAKLHLNKDCLGLTVFRHVRTLLIIVVGETIFGAASIGDAWHILSHVFVPYRGSLLSFGLDWKEYVVLRLGAAVLFAVDLLKEKKIDVLTSRGRSTGLFCRYGGRFICRPWRSFSCSAHTAIRILPCRFYTATFESTFIAP